MFCSVFCFLFCSFSEYLLTVLRLGTQLVKTLYYVMEMII